MGGGTVHPEFAFPNYFAIPNTFQQATVWNPPTSSDLQRLERNMESVSSCKVQCHPANYFDLESTVCLLYPAPTLFFVPHCLQGIHLVLNGFVSVMWIPAHMHSHPYNFSGATVFFNATCPRHSSSPTSVFSPWVIVFQCDGELCEVLVAVTVFNSQFHPFTSK